MNKDPQKMVEKNNENGPVIEHGPIIDNEEDKRSSSTADNEENIHEQESNNQRDASGVFKTGIYKQSLFLISGVGFASLILMIAGAWLYSSLGLQIFGGNVVDRLAAYEIRLDQIESQISEFSARDSALADRVDELAVKIDARSKDAARFVDIEKLLEEQNEKIAAISERTNQEPNIGNTDKLDERIQKTQNALNALTKQFAELSKPIISLAPEREALANSLTIIANEIRSDFIPEQANESDNWATWLAHQLSRFYKINDRSNQLSNDLIRIANRQDIQAAISLIEKQENIPPELEGWLIQAREFQNRLVNP